MGVPAALPECRGIAALTPRLIPSSGASADSPAPEAEEEGLHAVSLRCEYLVDPLGIDTSAPRWSWQLSAARCYWAVRVWDEAGRPGPWSAPAWFEMGLLGAADWKATWVRAPDPAISSPLLRKEFALPGPVPQRVYVAGLRVSELYGEAPRAIVQLLIETAGGDRRTVTSDTTWRTAASPILANDLCDGEFYDARREQPGWSEAGFDDAHWQPAAAPEPVGPLQAQMIPPVKKPHEISESERTIDTMSNL